MHARRVVEAESVGREGSEHVRGDFVQQGATLRRCVHGDRQARARRRCALDHASLLHGAQQLTHRLGGCEHLAGQSGLAKPRLLHEVQQHAEVMRCQLVGVEGGGEDPTHGLGHANQGQSHEGVGVTTAPARGWICHSVSVRFRIAIRFLTPRMDLVMTLLTSAVLRHRLLVALAWLVVAVAGAATAPTTADRLSFDFNLPGQAAFETNEKIVDQFGGGGLNDPLLFLVSGDGVTERAEAVAAAARQAVPGTRTVSPSDAGADVLAAGNSSAVVVVYPPVDAGPEPYVSSSPPLEQVAKKASAGGVEVTLSGFSVLEQGGGDDHGLLFEVLVGALGALIVLALVFGSLLAGLPLLVAAVSILGTFLALFGLTKLTDVSAVVEYLIALIGLGVAIDYSLLVVTRWREERAKGGSNDDAVRTAMATAGRSVLFSGVTVAVSLAALVLVPVPFLRSIGLGGLLIPLFSVAVSLTLVPALLSAVGPKLNWPRRKPAVTRSRLWAAITTRVLRRRWLTAIGSVIVLLALAAPALSLTLGTPQLSGVSSTSPASKALTTAVSDGLPAGVVRPTEVVVPEADVDNTLTRLDHRGWRGRRSRARHQGMAQRGPGPPSGLDEGRSVQRAGRATLDRIRRSPTTGTPRSAARPPRTPTSSQRSTGTRSGSCSGSRS